MKINPEAGTVKGGEACTVPRHPHVVEQGFLKFVQKVGKGPLFYEPNGQRVKRDDLTNPVQAPWVKQRNKVAVWVRDLGVTDPNISSDHAWRHTFKRKAARAGIEKRIRFAFCGHTSSDVGDEYETHTVEAMAKEMMKLPLFVVTRDD